LYQWFAPAATMRHGRVIQSPKSIGTSDVLAVMMMSASRGTSSGALAGITSTPSRFDGPPRILCLGFQLKEGRLTGPRDMFADPGFDRARQQANEIADYLRRMGPFEPHRAGLDELEYTTMPSLIERFASRWVDERVPEPALKS